MAWMTASGRSMVTVLCRAPPGTRCSPRLTEPASAAHRRRLPSAIARTDSRGEQPHAGVDAQGGEDDHRHVGQVPALLELAGELGHVAPFPHACLPPLGGEVSFDELATDRLWQPTNILAYMRAGTSA
jgi:hypothetical protein